MPTVLQPPDQIRTTISVSDLTLVIRHEADVMYWMGQGILLLLASILWLIAVILIEALLPPNHSPITLIAFVVTGMFLASLVASAGIRLGLSLDAIARFRRLAAAEGQVAQ